MKKGISDTITLCVIVLTTLVIGGGVVIYTRQNDENLLKRALAKVNKNHDGKFQNQDVSDLLTQLNTQYTITISGDKDIPSKVGDKTHIDYYLGGPIVTFGRKDLNNYLK